MSKTKVIELIICILSIIALVLAATTDVFATTPGVEELLNQNVNNDYEQIPGLNTNTNVNTNVNTNTNTNTNTNINKNTSTNTNKNVNNTPNELTDAGIDSSISLVILVCGISAVYAYKKIKDYNNI